MSVGVEVKDFGRAAYQMREMCRPKVAAVPKDISYHQ